MIKLGYITGLVLLLAGCSQGVSSQTQDAATPSVSNTAQMLETQEPPVLPSEGNSMPTFQNSSIQNLIEKAKQDLAQRLSIPIDQINLNEAKEVIWSDSSLGCPQPGMVYAQVLTPGYLILLEFDSKTFEYHTSRETDILLCENPLPPFQGTPDNT